MDKYFDLIEYIEEGKLREVVAQFKKDNNINYISEYGLPLLGYAVVNNHLDIVKVFISNKCDINIKDLDLGRTALHYSCENGNFEMIKLLLENGADPSITDNSGNEPLLSAIISMSSDDSDREKEWVSIIELLILHGGNVNHKNLRGTSPLEIAFEDSDYQPLLDLLEQYKKQ